MWSDAFVVAIGLGALAAGAFIGWACTWYWLLANTNGSDSEDINYGDY